ncbi:MAG: phosphatase PAP2 family protein [Patescibacteria group bacterium]
MFRDFLRGLPANFVRVFAWPYTLWHVLAIVLTAILVLSDFDWWYFQHTRGAFLLSLTLPAAIIGWYIPIIGSASLYVWGEVHKSIRSITAAVVFAQASILGLLVSSFYKVFTGRQQPEFYTYTSSVDVSKDFQFGILEHGIFWGWPSSHVAVAFAMVTALMMMYPDNKYVRYLAPIYALYIVIGVSISIHWFSDALAGAIIGALVGVVVARSFKALRA